MDVLYIVVPLALVIAAAAVGAFIWMVQGGQLDDLESPALRMLHDDGDTVPKPKNAPADDPSEPSSEDDRPS